VGISKKYFKRIFKSGEFDAHYFKLLLGGLSRIVPYSTNYIILIECLYSQLFCLSAVQIK